jgi:hypothetical protein
MHMIVTETTQRRGKYHVLLDDGTMAGNRSLMARASC